MSTTEYTVLSSYAEHDRSVTDPDAIRNLTESTSQTFIAGGADEAVEGCLWRLWSAFIARAIETPSDRQGSLVEILREIQKCPSLSRGDGSDCKIWGLQVWKDLPVFGATTRESFDTVDHDSSAFPNFCSFLARVTVAFEGLPKLDFSLYAIWTFREAFEEPSEPTKMQIQACQQWMMHAGETLRSLSVAKHSFEGNLAKAGPAYTDKEWRGFNAERWNIWMTKLAKTTGPAHSLLPI